MVQLFLGKMGKAEVPQAKELASSIFQLIVSDQAADSREGFGAEGQL